MDKKKIFKKEGILLSCLVFGLGACEGLQTPSSGQSKKSSYSLELGEGGYDEDDGEIRGAAPVVEESPFDRGDGVMPDSLGSDYENTLPSI